MYLYYTCMHISRDFYCVSAVVNCPSSEHHASIRVFGWWPWLKWSKKAQPPGWYLCKDPVERSGTQLVEKDPCDLSTPNRDARTCENLGPKMWPDTDLARRKEGRLGQGLWNLKSMVILRDIPLMVQCLGWLYSEPCWRVLREHRRFTCISVLWLLGGLWKDVLLPNCFQSLTTQTLDFKEIQSTHSFHSLEHICCLEDVARWDFFWRSMVR